MSTLELPEWSKSAVIILYGIFVYFQTLERFLIKYNNRSFCSIINFFPGILHFISLLQILLLQSLAVTVLNEIFLAK